MPCETAPRDRGARESPASGPCRDSPAPSMVIVRGRSARVRIMETVEAAFRCATPPSDRTESMQTAPITARDRVTRVGAWVLFGLLMAVSLRLVLQAHRDHVLATADSPL